MARLSREQKAIRSLAFRLWREELRQRGPCGGASPDVYERMVAPDLYRKFYTPGANPMIASNAAVRFYLSDAYLDWEPAAA